MPAPKRNTADKFLTGKQFQVWRNSRGLTYDEIADWLGVHPNSVMNYAKVGLTRTQALAIAALERGLPPWQPAMKDWTISGLVPGPDEYPSSESKPDDAESATESRETPDDGNDELPSKPEGESVADAPCDRPKSERA